MRIEREAAASMHGLVTVLVADQYFAMPLSRVRKVFVPDRLSPVPLAPREISGVLNLRGQIVTALDLRMRLGLAPKPAERRSTVALAVEKDGELFGLIGDEAGEALRVMPSRLEPAPANLDARWARLCAGICRLESGFLTVLDVDRVLEINRYRVAA